MESPPSTSPTPAPAPAVQRKLFVGGITSDTTEEALSEHFGKYGELKDVVVIRDLSTGIGRGFGFVEFAAVEAAAAALDEQRHVIHGRMVEVNRAFPRGSQNQFRSQCQSGEQCGAPGEISRKIFVGGLPATTTEDDFRGYFERFGAVTDSVIIYDNATNKPRGFGFITFDTESAVENVMQDSHHKLNGKFVEVKLAIPRDAHNCRNNDNGHDSNYGARAAFRGEPAFCGYQGQLYPPFASANPCFRGPLHHPSYSYGGNNFNGYAGYGYGYGYGYDSHYANPRVSWSGRPSISSGQGCFPYDNAVVYPRYQTGYFGGNMNIATEYDIQSIKDNTNGLNTHTADAVNVTLQSEALLVDSTPQQVEFILPHTSSSQANVGSLESVALQNEDLLSDVAHSQAEVKSVGQSLSEASSEVEDITQEMAGLQVKAMPVNNTQ